MTEGDLDGPESNESKRITVTSLSCLSRWTWRSFDTEWY